jgi:DNA-binding NarL/FixJ family response regulator
MAVGKRSAWRSPLKIGSRRILIVDDSRAWRRAVRSILQEHLDLMIIGECSDGFEAVQKSEELQPDLVLLDIGLPNLNGVEAARQIRQVAPASRILFLSSYNWPEILHEAMSVGALGFVVKVKASCELLLAIRTVLRGQRFIGTGFSPFDPTKPPHS